MIVGKRRGFCGVGALVALVIVAGCGGGGGNQLSADQEVVVAGFRADVAAYAFSGSSYGSLLDSMDATIAIAREDPDATYQVGEGEQEITMRQVLADAASDLEEYDADLSSELDRAVQTLD